MDKIISFKTTVLAFSCLGSLFTQAQIEKGDDLPVPSKKQAEFYLREEIPMPKGEVLEVSSIALMPNQQIAVGTRRGEVWICTGAYEKDLSKVTWSKAYAAAHQPLGMFYKDGWLYMTDRGAYGRIADKNKDGTYETYETISDEWGTSGDYHEYVWGSTPDTNGNVYVANCLTGSYYARAKWKGWIMKIAPDGKTTPYASGVRSPGGIGYNAEGDLFYIDNQGRWNGTSCLKPIAEGSFTGCPIGNIFYDDAPNMKRPLEPIDGSRIVTEAARIPEFIPPAVNIPHGKLGQSPTAVITDSSDGKFGAFKNQLLIGEQTHSQVQRIYLEKVNGVYQGAVWPFLDGFQCGIVPMRMGDDGSLFVGGTNRGWASLGDKSESFERVRATGKIPFEMKTMNATPDGFKISFTKPVNKEIATDIKNYDCNAWTYIYQHAYGSPEVDKVKPVVTKASVSEDGLTVTLVLDKLTKGHVHHVECLGLKSTADESLWHSTVYYTLNQIPTK